MENNTYIENIPENFWTIRFLDKYMAEHKGFIAGGCFKNILSKEKVKDIDIFFECDADFFEAVDLFNSDNYIKDGWKFKYRNEKVCAFQKEGDNIWIELVESIFGTPEEILRNFDFTVTKMAYFKDEVISTNDDGKLNISNQYKLIYHKDFFEHLHQKRLVLDEKVPFPISTWERTYRYGKYGFQMCRETKKKLLNELRKTTEKDEELSMYLQGGWD